MPPAAGMLANEGIHLFKFWLNVGRATQLERFLDREKDPLKQWKLSWIDAEGLRKWDEYSAAIAETLIRTHHARAPWTCLRRDDKEIKKAGPDFHRGPASYNREDYGPEAQNERHPNQSTINSSERLYP